MKRKFSEYDPEKVACWSSQNDIGPDQVAYASSKRFWFKCPTCDHDFFMQLSSITCHNSWCAYCTSRVRCPSEKNCGTCYSKSFAGFDPVKVSCWSDRNEKKPEYFSKSSHTKVYFDCNVCGHEFEQTMHNVASGKWCPYCVNRKRCEDVLNCSTCLSKTFAGYDPDKVKCWSSKNELMPHEVAKSANKKFLFDCDKCLNEFRPSLNDVTNGKWCPHCASNKAMKKLHKRLSVHSDFTFKKEVIVKLDSRNLKWDAVVEKDGKKFHIESDGAQHFSEQGIINVSRGRTTNSRARFADQRTRDLLKEQHIKNTGGLLFRISYRQLKEIDDLVDTMIQRFDSGETGVVYLDSIYTCWCPIDT